MTEERKGGGLLHHAPQDSKLQPKPYAFPSGQSILTGLLAPGMQSLFVMKACLFFGRPAVARMGAIFWSCQSLISWIATQAECLEAMQKGGSHEG